MNNEDQKQFNNTQGVSNYNGGPPSDLLNLVNNNQNNSVFLNNSNNNSSNHEVNQPIVFNPNMPVNNNQNMSVQQVMTSINQANIDLTDQSSSSSGTTISNVNYSDNLNSNVSKNTTNPTIDDAFQRMDIDDLMRQTGNDKVQMEIKTKKDNKLFLGITAGSAVLFVVVLLVALFSNGKLFSFIGSKVYYQDKVIEGVGQYQTAVVTDNVYEGVTINNEEDAINLIIKDANNQKAKCSNKKIKEIETRIEKNYGIIAVNLCEIDQKFALEIENTIKTVYKEFPNIRGYLTNLTLINAPEFSDYIASFVSARLFAKADTVTTYPNVYKMSIFLNASYFLNPRYFNETIKDSVAYGYFPKNTTRYSIVAHEFGHYLSFLAQVNNTEGVDELLLLNSQNYSTYSKLIADSNNGTFSQKMITEAYNNYKKKKPNKFSDEYEFRSSISDYAVATDENGNYILDETIAEAFHDYYLNRNKAADASKEIVSVLKKYLK